MFVTTIDLITILTSMALCATAAGCCLKSLRLVREIRSLRSLQSEIVEIDASVESLIKTIRRIEGRQTARMRRDQTLDSTDTEATTSVPETLDKAALRRYFGIVPGKPVTHGST